MSEEARGDLVPQDHGAIVPSVMPTGQVGRTWTRLDLTTDEGRRVFHECQWGETLDSSKVLNQVIPVVNVVAQYVMVESRELPGEMVRAPRVCLVLLDGSIVRFVSEGVRDSLAEIMALWGEPPWPNGFDIKVVQIPTKRQRSMLVLKPIKLNTGE